MIGEWIIQRFSQEIDLPADCALQTEPLKLLEHEYPDLDSLLRGKRVLDFGCGHGDQSFALHRKYACEVTGLDIQEHFISAARAKYGERVRYTTELGDERYDVVISQNSMEHFRNPQQVLADMRRVLAPGGVVLVTFGPPWFAPYGSHMHFFCRIPWLQLWFSERAVMKVRSRYRRDGAKRYVDVEGGLNQMSLAKFERLARESGLKVHSIEYHGVRRMHWLTRVPLLREFFTTHVTAILGL
jgi:ubiquinone/menaquinone biosynthesis C-methylase UbiE